MNTSFKLLFHIRNQKVNTKTPQPIYLWLTINGQRIEIAIQREIDPSLWDDNLGRQIGKKVAAKVLNAHLDTLMAKVYECQNDLIRNGIPVNITT